MFYWYLRHGKVQGNAYIKYYTVLYYIETYHSQAYWMTSISSFTLRHQAKAAHQATRLACNSALMMFESVTCFQMHRQSIARSATGSHWASSLGWFLRRQHIKVTVHYQALQQTCSRLAKCITNTSFWSSPMLKVKILYFPPFLGYIDYINELTSFLFRPDDMTMFSSFIF